jgi:hypothetical protein
MGIEIKASFTFVIVITLGKIYQHIYYSTLFQINQGGRFNTKEIAPFKDELLAPLG